MVWLDRGGRYKADLPTGTFGGQRYKIQIQDKVTGEVFDRLAYRTSEKWGYLQDFKLQFKGKTEYLSDILEIPMTDAKKGRSHAKKIQAKVTSKVKLWAEYCPECDGKSDVQGVQRDKVIFVCRECGRRWSRPVEVLYLHNKRTGELRLDPLAAVARATKNLHQKSQAKRGRRA